ncbi:prostaglandin reductase 1-like [Sitodiplosis mosellana]|uniref:prostaglandin reductase 1-like n=1 Tax=Sitodiplosis mosellana TaxID=263140 RepID=UPI0024448FF4|nr:prostaglandin reductase 1-like [Sitodiplosis mosellana]
MVKARKFVFASIFDGEPKQSDFELQFEELPTLEDGDVLVETIYWSVDPYMRVQMPKLPVNSTMIGENIARVIESNDPKYPVGSYVWSFFGWRDLTIFNNNMDKKEKGGNHIPPYIVEPIANIPLSQRLASLGMTGLSAYFGLIELCAPKANETIVISGAAGAVGSIVGQIGKILNCRVVGVAGSAEKCRWLKEELNFDAAIDYKNENIEEALQRLAPNGIDVYFDNVGGELSSIVMSQMNEFGRVALCGAISTYNLKSDRTTNIPIQPIIIAKQLKVEGFIVNRWFMRWEEGVAKLSQWILAGQLKYRETISNGFDSLPTAFIGMLRGDNIGKALVKK